MLQAAVILVWLAYLLYAAAFAVFLIGFFTQRPWMNRAGLIVAACGLVAQTLGLIFRGVAAGHFPFVGLYESLTLVSWAIVLVWHVLESFTKIKAVGLYVMPIVLVLLTIALVSYEAPLRMAPALRSDIVIVHVSVMLVAIGCLYVAGGAAIIYLIEEALLRRRKTGGVLGRLPSLATLDRLIYHATALGVPFLTMGMAAGIIRAETFKVPGWPTDPMVLLSVAAWAVYVALIAGRVRGDWSGRAVSWLAVAGLVLLLVIRFAAVPYLSGFHTYGG
ncbi:MAG TPA: cytochrome c biogenesis protein CcsA [Thermoleophilia bacterium]|nr:cytochrome c biogenesis protein CcsA [Thermoleophilia bacterium]